MEVKSLSNSLVDQAAITLRDMVDNFNAFSIQYLLFCSCSMMNDVVKDRQERPRERERSSYECAHRVALEMGKFECDEMS